MNISPLPALLSPGIHPFCPGPSERSSNAPLVSLGGRRWLVLAAMLVLFGGHRMRAAGHTRLVPLPAPQIVAASEADPNGTPVENLIDGDPKTEYGSAGKGLQTFVEFDFGTSTELAGFRHQDRSDHTNGNTVGTSELIFFDASGREVGRRIVAHSGRGSGIAFQAFSPAITARRVRWQVTKLGATGTNLGGAELSFFRAGDNDAAPTGITIDAIAVPLASRTASGVQQPLNVSLDSPYREPIDATIQVGDQPPRAVRLVAGPQTVEFSIPVAAQERRWSIVLADATKATFAHHDFVVPAFRELTIYVLPHSHVDIGFTEIQSNIEEKQLNNLFAGIAAARRTADYPEGARFVWNLENLWPADLLLRRLNSAQRDIFFAAVRSGQVALNGMYANTLTGLCRPEDLVQLFRMATQLRAQIGVPLDSAMISDVPGYTWGTVSAMAQAGIKYFSVAPNHFDRIGNILEQTENKPFWWVGPSGHERVLVWVPSQGYGLSHIIHQFSPQWVADYAEELTRIGYPYDLAYVRWVGQGDNGAPDPAICDFVKDWNAEHPWPHFIIGSTHDAFRALEEKYGAQLPERRGDWTPYWEDGAASSAAETATNRASSDRLTQANALWAMQEPRSYPTADFANTIRDVLLYSEHTWGSTYAVRAPFRHESLEQWSVKQSYAVTADRQSRDLLSRALSLATVGETVPAAVDVFNTSSWIRTDLVVLPRSFSLAGDRVTDEQGQPVLSQRLASNDLVILARDVPPFSARRYTIAAGQPFAEGKASADGVTLDNGLLKVVLDPKTGGIVELRAQGIAANLADSDSGEALNDYLYFNGSDPSKARHNGPVTIHVKEKGPLVASLVVESTAPGCIALTREIKLVAGQDYVELSNLVDKQRIVAPDYRAPEAKESVNFAFPFHVPGGQMRVEVPFGVVRPDDDQIPGACKNWLTVNRWADIANADYGVTWVSLDAPLIEVGGLTANLLNSQTNPDVWRKHIGPAQKLYAWVMNNHWGTNYRAYQEGPVMFRFLLRPHHGYNPTEDSQLAIAASQPLLPVRAHGAQPMSAPRFTVDSPDVIVTGVKPSDDGRAIIVRLWGAGGRDAKIHVQWSAPSPSRVTLSDTSEQPRDEIDDSIAVPAWGVVTLRADLP